MHSTHLRKVGGSVMLAIPPAILEMLGLRPGAQVGLSIEGERLLVQPRMRPQYSLDELMALCDPSAEQHEDEREWLAGEPAGKELL